MCSRKVVDLVKYFGHCGHGCFGLVAFPCELSKEVKLSLSIVGRFSSSLEVEVASCNDVVVEIEVDGGWPGD